MLISSFSHSFKRMSSSTSHPSSQNATIPTTKNHFINEKYISPMNPHINPLTLPYILRAKILRNRGKAQLAVPSGGSD